jgi:nicotinamidase-related amidase
LELNLMTTALLIIDVQRALCTGADEAFESRRVIDRINHVLGLARETGAPVFVIQHEEQGGPLEYGSDGWKLDPALNVVPSDIYVRKTATDSFHHTELHAALQARGIRKLVICGFQSEFCVDSTTRRALALGYPVTLVADGHSTVDNGVLKASQISGHHNETLRKIDSFGPRVQTLPAAEVRVEA